MAFGRKKANGLDLSGVGDRSIRLQGGSLRSQSGLSFTSGRSERDVPPSGAAKDGTYVRSHDGTADDGKRPWKTKLLIALLIVGSLALATAVGVFVYDMTAKNALTITLDDEALSAVLADADDDASGSWNVIVRTDASSATAGHGQLVSACLAYTSTSTPAVSFLWIPVDTRAYLAGHGYTTLEEAFSLEGEAGVVSAVVSLADVSVSHYFEVNVAGLSALHDALDVASADDADEQETTDVSACAAALLAADADASALATSVCTCVSTDVDADTLADLLTSLQGTDASAVYHAQAPTESDESGALVLQSDAWMTMLTRAEGGLSPEASDSELAADEALRDAATVTVWNGVGVTGVAADCAEELEKLGWTVEETTNAGQYVYDETFIIYKDTDDEELANLLAEDLGQGRVVKSNARYEFSTTLLVVVGSDYQPY